VAARSSWEYSAESIPVSVKASQIPDAPTPATTAVDGLHIDVAWTVPYNQETELTAYVVKFQGADLNYYLELIDCDASETTIFST
jgi:hypothetical protein